MFEPRLVLAELTDLAPYVPTPLCRYIDTRRAMAYAGTRVSRAKIHTGTPTSLRSQRLCECLCMYGGGDVPTF